MAELRPSGRYLHSERIRKRSEYLQIQAEARRARTRSFILLVRAGSPAAPPRLGTIVTKRVGNAVVRNRAKRLIREAFRALRSDYRQGLEFVVIVRRPLTGLGLRDVVAEWRDASRHLQRLLREAEKDRQQRESRLADEA